ncbi:type VII secretion protein EccE [Streptomyces hoynatensis]|uniref:Type VII secretion system protein EccE domain-containing protein n=1 Tax=Streptomyces hoynatensis TaxID=1141874 RepID=A0A3A9ZE30_9ACTN|nr:type VII secretion protein EccE [Streptomyces hoynatensis]RKN45606.1 hypothetical protein D7294_03795 [Streptomyces hoynatensis]
MRGRLLVAETGLGCLAAGTAWQGPGGWALAGAGAAVTAGALAFLDRRLAGRLGPPADPLAPGALPGPAHSPAAGEAGEAGPGRPVAATEAGRPPGEDLGLVHRLLPALDVTSCPDRNGPEPGVLADGRGYAAVLAFPGGTLPALPVELVADWLAGDPARPAVAQLLVEQFGVPPWDFLHRYQPTVAYRQLPTAGRPVAVRAFLVARYEPFDAPEAAERRGGGAAGARAAVVAATARLRARLAAGGAPTVTLGAVELRALLREMGDASGEGRALPGSWAGSAATHCSLTAEVRTQADWYRLLGALSSSAADRAIAAATLSLEEGTPRVRAALRLVGAVAQQAAAERDRLLRAGAVGPPAPDQRAALLATLPLAHPVRSVAEAAGFVLAAER